jgi:valyl-tRNA synthetase
VTEEVWSWWQDGSVHRQPWPQATELGAAASTTPTMLTAVGQVLTGMRGAKSQAKVKMRAPLASVRVSGPVELVGLAERAAEDLRAAGTVVGDLLFVSDPSAEELQVTAQISPDA